MTYTSIEQIKEANRRIGHCFFLPDTMRFWKSRVGSEVYPDTHGGAYFVTSEMNYDGTERAYTVRYCSERGECGMAAGTTFLGYSRKAAHNMARKLAKGTA